MRRLVRSSVYAAFALAMSAPLAAQTTTVVLVRHAEKAAAPADDPPLSPAGQLRAAALDAALADWRLDVILVTPTTRTRQTAQPISTRLRLQPVEVPNTGTLQERIAGIARIVREQYAGKRVLIVGHSNTIPAIVGALGGPAMPSFCDPTEYSNLLVMELPANGAPTLIRATYGAADAPAPPACSSTMR